MEHNDLSIKIANKELKTLEEKQAKIKEFNRKQEALLSNLKKS